jgi:type VI secretion system FHA domain protein
LKIGVAATQASKPTSSKRVAAPKQTPAADEITLADVLRKAGVDPAQVDLSPGIVEQLADALRIVIEGTMDTLKVRNDIRRELRISSTMMATRENNPLKFSADADDALHKLLVQRSHAYLDMAAAFREAFGDIRHHQVAMLKSVGVAFDYMLSRFDPKILEKQFAPKPGSTGILSLTGKIKPWQAFVEYYAELRADHERTYRRLFGEEWAKAYEQELMLQKSSAHKPKGPDK